MKNLKNKPPFYLSLALKNFRGFKSLNEIKLAPLTFLVGPNSSGKSSLFDSLLLLAQSEFFPSTEYNMIPDWTGILVDLGSFSDTVYSHNPNLLIEISIKATSNLFSISPKESPVPMGLSYTLRAKAGDQVGKVTKIIVEDIISSEKFEIKYYKSKVVINMIGVRKVIMIPKIPMKYQTMLSNEFQVIKKKRQKQLKGKLAAWNRIYEFLMSLGIGLYLGSQRVSSGRSAPKRWYSSVDILRKRSESLFWHPFEPKVFDSVDPTLIEDLPKDDMQFFTKRDKIIISTTLKNVLKDLDIANKINSIKLSAYHSKINITDKHTNIESNLMDVGYGTSQVIPIIKACLTETKSPLFVEQPEIHLHPKAQGVVADLLAKTSKHRQVVVETHSVRMINRARLLVAKGELSENNIIVHYVYKSKTGSRVKTIHINSYGDFVEEWPEGFFDERYEDTMYLLKLKSQKNNI